MVLVLEGLLADLALVRPFSCRHIRKETNQLVSVVSQQSKPYSKLVFLRCCYVGDSKTCVSVLQLNPKFDAIECNKPTIHFKFGPFDFINKPSFVRLTSKCMPKKTTKKKTQIGLTVNTQQGLFLILCHTQEKESRGKP